MAAQDWTSHAALLKMTIPAERSAKKAERMDERPHGDDPVIAALARASLGALPHMADQLVDQLWGDVYGPSGPVPKDDLWRSCHDNMGSMLTALSGAGPTPDTLLRAARDTGSRRAYQHCPLDWVLHAWRLGGQVMWEELARHAVGTDNSDTLRELVGSAHELWGITERFSIEMASTYQRREHELTHGPDQHVLAFVDALLDGSIGDERTEVEHALGIGPASRLLVVAAEGNGDGSAVTPELAQAMRDSGFRVVWRLRAGCEVGIVTTERSDVSTLVELLRAHATSRLGISPELNVVTDVASGYRMAVLAMSTLPQHRADAVTLDDCLPQALMLGSPELAERMVSVTFGPILALPQIERDELLTTISTWIRVLGSTHRAAKALYCHRNTVLNRIRRAEALTNLDLGDVGSWPQVIMALNALGRYGSSKAP